MVKIDKSKIAAMNTIYDHHSLGIMGALHSF